MHQKYDMSGNLFSTYKNNKSVTIMPSNFNGCFDINKKELELKDILQGNNITNDDSYDTYRDYTCCCCKRKCFITILERDFFTLISKISQKILDNFYFANDFRNFYSRYEENIS